MNVKISCDSIHYDDFMYLCDEWCHIKSFCRFMFKNRTLAEDVQWHMKIVKLGCTQFLIFSIDIVESIIEGVFDRWVSILTEDSCATASICITG